MRQDVLVNLAYICKKNAVFPTSINYMALILKVCCTKFAIPPRKVKEYAETLAIAYRTDGWKSYLERVEEQEQLLAETSDLTVTKMEDLMDKEYVAEKVETQPAKHKPTIKEIMASIKPSGEPVHPPPPPQSTQTDRLTMSQLAEVFCNMARRDTSPDNIGRILLSEARDVSDDKHLVAGNVIAIWRSRYPLIDIELATHNVLLIYWDGKQKTLENRRARPPIVPKVGEPFQKGSRVEVETE